MKKKEIINKLDFMKIKKASILGKTNSIKRIRSKPDWEKIFAKDTSNK